MKRLLIAVLALVVMAVGALFAWMQLDPAGAHARLGALERDRAGLEAKRLRIPGFEIAYLEGGTGEPLVLIHGFGANKDNFTRVARHLTPHYRVFAIDLPGFGESSKPADARYGMREQSERLAQILDALQLPAAHFGGSSMGGWLVSSFAVFYPDRVRSLWLLAPGGVATAEESEVRRVYRETGELMLVAESPEDFGRVLDVVFAKPPFIPSPIRRVLAEQAAANRPLHTRIFTELGEEAFWLEPQLAGNPVPALIVWGEEDRVLHVSGAEVFKSLLPNGQVQILDGIGHLPMLEAPETVAEAYLTFRSTL